MSDEKASDDSQTEHNQAQAAQTGQKQTDAAADTPLNGGEHTESGSYTNTNEQGVDYDGAFTDSDIPEEGVKPGETEVDKAGFEGGYTESDRPA
ncbi:hypothetical protein GCM10025867_27950 [Frondihabitans sucicola]|uniref:Uncharacterized protein n=1 Tax=Frondihabitans sucicola TaxID=1268041 RepID=A0ABM8GQ39_9MICO|nr:hypothetical protein [Frondihabitans sucicola]BDZ50554.1 hypothetical protein GCM10025867_27950 [Frondihabitans sucicola]